MSRFKESHRIRIVYGEQHSQREFSNDDYLASKKLFKTLSLVLSERSGITVPYSLMLVDPCWEAIEEFGQAHGWPLMIRMDFSRLPRPKTLGGIPLRSLLVAKEVSTFLFERHCVPLFHPHLDRFKDQYSCGVMIGKRDRTGIIEVVGRGFDASDLRLGKTSPHESFEVELGTGSFVRKSSVSTEVYSRQREERLRRIRLFKDYIDYANNYGVLSADLQGYEGYSAVGKRGLHKIIPKKYTPIPHYEVKHLIELAMTIQSDVLPNLSFSDKYIASFSKLPKSGWILWDIYGSWYNR